MAKATRLLDVWIVETKAVYTDVPFSVVVDWIQQGRLLAGDRVRLAGNKAWHTIDKVPSLAPYLPADEPLETHATSESLEPVELGWSWKRPEESEDEDVDMIPLIDISLVLLIFFMMTATISSGVLAPIKTPETKYPAGVLAADQFWIGIDVLNPKGVEQKKDGKTVVWYSFGHDDKQMMEPTNDFDSFRAELTRLFASLSGEKTIRIRADRSLSVDAVTGIIREMREMQSRLNRDRRGTPVTLTLLAEVSEPR